MPLAEHATGLADGRGRATRRRGADRLACHGDFTAVANVAPKVMARVLEVRVQSRRDCAAGDVIAVLDDRDVRARAAASPRRTARCGSAGDAGRSRSAPDTALDKGGGTRQDLDASEARTAAARAQVSQARDAIRESAIVLGETTVRAPFNGVVAERLVDPGDMAAPGRPLR